MGMGVFVDIPETYSRCSKSVNLDVRGFDLSKSAVLTESFRPSTMCVARVTRPRGGRAGGRDEFPHSPAIAYITSKSVNFFRSVSEVCCIRISQVRCYDAVRMLLGCC